MATPSDDTHGLPRPGTRATGPRTGVGKALGEREAGRLILRNFVRTEQERLRRLRQDLGETSDAPDLDAACAHARTFDACQDATLARRYEASQALELHRNLDGFDHARSKAEAHHTDAPPSSVPVPNERQDRQICDVKSQIPETSESPTARPQASPGHPEGVATASPGRQKGDSGRRRLARQAARAAWNRSRGKSR